ncbi:hypothetical protein WJX77_004584 [Trebouxia sp. C0004]
MCGPLGTMFCGVLSMFGAVFMAVLAIAISKDYDYLGEWFDASDEALYGDKRSEAMSNCWVVGWQVAIPSTMLRIQYKDEQDSPYIQ